MFLFWRIFSVIILSNLVVLDYQKNISLEIFCGDIISETFGEGKFCPEYSIESNENEILVYLDCPWKH